MKSRLLIIIGIIVVIATFLSYYAIYDSSTTVFITCDPRYEQIDDKCILKISEDEFKELECLRLYKDIRELSRTPEMALADQQTVNMHKNLVFEYVENNCPDFNDLEFIYNNYKQNMPEPEFSLELILDSIFNSDIIPDSTLNLNSITKDDPIQIQITNGTATQICKELKMKCPVGYSFNAIYDLNTQVATFQQSVGLHIYDLTISNSRICHTLNGDTQNYCTTLHIPYSTVFDGNKSTLLSKTIGQWQNMTDDELYLFYEKYGDEFYTELGKIILKNEIKNELKRQNIVNANNDFILHVTGIDQSLPPDVYLQVIVNGTDGKRYQFDGGTSTNQVLNLSFKELKN